MIMKKYKKNIKMIFLKLIFFSIENQKQLFLHPIEKITKKIQNKNKNKMLWMYKEIIITIILKVNIKIKTQTLKKFLYKS
jgi:hypothetical protein